MELSSTAVRTAADIVLTVHVLYVAFVVFGFVAIIWGAALRRGWVRNPLFRFLHLGAIAIVALQALLGLPCPLTVWERDLRRAAGQDPTDLEFIPRLLQSVLFFELPPEFFLALYLGFTALVILTLWLVPPRLQRRLPQQH